MSYDAKLDAEDLDRDWAEALEWERLRAENAGLRVEVETLRAERVAAYQDITSAFQKLREPNVGVGYALDALAGLQRKLEPR